MKNLTRSCPKLRSGFTLIELLVVVTIIVVLLALLAPALDKAIEATEAVVCATNLRRSQEVFYSYQTDHKNYWPAPWGKTSDYAYQWPYIMQWYAVPSQGSIPANPASKIHMNPTSTGFFLCPNLLADKVYFPRTYEVAAYPEPLRSQISANSIFTSWSYGMIAPNYNLTGYPKISRFQRPSDTVHLHDMATVSTGNAVPQEATPNIWSNYNSISTDPHNRTSNYAFTDGHIERLSHRYTQLEDGSYRDLGESDLRPDAWRAY